jgi:hypothetical protein
VKTLLQSIFHPFQHYNNSANNQINLVREDKRSPRVFFVALEVFVCVSFLAPKAIGRKRFLDLEGKANRNPNDLDSQPGPSPHVGIPQSPKGIFEF